MKLRYIPNAFSISRILLCIPLFLLTPFTPLYLVLFIFAGITDTFDGQLARRIKGGASELGATLDSIGDILLVCVIVFVIMPTMQIWSWLGITYACVLLTKIIASTGIGFIRFKEFISLHTISLKVLVMFLFSYPVLYYITGAGMFINVFSAAIVICGTFVVIEEILIISMTKRPERNLKSIFGVKAANRAYIADKQKNE
jgi:CDP-diacylglycerol--glycerol-3-phosphate 3-phosphatidyltransferase